MKNLNKGFTLIELLVVISIISYLSSIVLNQISSARAKAKDTAIIESMKQLEVLANLEYNDNKRYSNLQTSTWYTISNNACNNFAGNYQSQATALCLKIIANASNWYYNGYNLYIGNVVDQNTRFSFMAAMNSSNSYYCVGSSGSSYTTDTGSWTGLGCYGNP